MTNYQWARNRRASQSGYVFGDINQPYAAYFSDERAGVRAIAQKPPDNDFREYTWRIEIKSHDGIELLDGCFSYQRVGPGSDQIRFRQTEGRKFIWFPICSPGTHCQETSGSTITMFFPFHPREDNLNDARAGTTVIHFEERIDNVIVAGGLNSSAGLLGTYGGFDFRTIGIRNLVVDKKVTDLSSDENIINVTGDVHALPGHTVQYPAGWRPNGQINCTVRSQDKNRSASYWSDFQRVDQDLGAVPADGKIASFSFSGAADPNNSSLPAGWNGKDDSGNGEPVYGFYRMEATASASNPDFGNTLVSQPQWENCVTYKCACQGGANSVRFDWGTYISFLSDVVPNSLGYGWNSNTSSRVVDTGSSIILKAGGSNLRWDDVNGSYVAYDPANYAVAEKDLSNPNYPYKVTFRDQTVYEFGTDLNLSRVTDRNNNKTTYEYFTGTTHVKSISDENGNAMHYTIRSDGQPLTMRENENGGTTGRTTTFEYYSDTHATSPDRLHKVIDPEGNETVFAYDSDGRLETVTDPEGNVASTYVYDELGRLESEERYGEVKVTQTYSNFTLGSRNDVITTVQEDIVGSEEDRFTTVDRDRHGNTVWIRQTLNSGIGGTTETVLEYNDPNNPNLMTKRIDPNLTVTEMTYTLDGKVKTMTDKEGNVTTYTYAEEIDSPLNPKHRDLIREILRPQVTTKDGKVTYNPTTFEYDSNGNLEKVTDAKGQETTMTYTSDGLVSTIKDRRGNTTEFVYEGLAFNGDSRDLLEIKVPKGDVPADGFRRIRFAYDKYHNVTSVKDDLDNEIVTEYDLLDRVEKITDARGWLTEYKYGNSLLDEIFLPRNNASGTSTRRTEMIYDSSNRVQEVKRDIDSSGTQETRVKYGYTSFGEMASLTRFKGSNENSFTFSYDRIGRQIQATDDLGQVSSSAYEPFCEGQTGTSARGIRQRTNFDARCLLREVETGDVDTNNALNILNPRESYTWEYDELGRMVESSKSKIVYGQAVFGLADFADSDQTEYDELDRVVRVVRTPEGQDEYEFLFEYDEEGNLTKTTEPNDRVTEYSYYRDNLLKEVIVKRPSETDRVFTYSYDPAGRLDKIVYPSETGIEAVFRDEADLSATGIGTGFDENGNIRFLRYQKTDTQLTAAQALIRRFEWTYDESNNRDSMLDVTPGEAIKWEYGMDWLDRLVSVKRASASTVAALPATTLQREYEFDESDNRTYFDDHVNGKTYHYVYKSYDDNGTTRYSDQLEEIQEASSAGERDPNNFSLFESFEHDLDGNMIKRTLAATSHVTDYDWTDFDRLKKVTSSSSGTLQEARYDVGGLRERKTDKNGNSSVEYALGISTSASEPATGTSPPPSISYISGHMILGAEIDGEFVYHLGDALSSIRDVYGYDSGAQGWTVVRSFEFDEYGNQISTSGSGTHSPKTWIGGLSVNDDTGDSGMFNMGHRNYAGGVLGRFISRDPIGFEGGLALYGYPTNPVKSVDPTGLEEVLIYLPQQDVNAFNKMLGTLISREQIRRDIQSRLRDLLDCDKIDVKLINYHLDFASSDTSFKRPFSNLHLSSAHLWYQDERGWFSPGGYSHPRRARVSGPGLLMTRDSSGLSMAEISNVARNVIIHETIGHALAQIGNTHGTGLWQGVIDVENWKKRVLFFDKDFSGHLNENDAMRRKLKMNIGCKH